MLPDYDLNLISLNSVADLPLLVGKGLVVAAKINGTYYFRIFDWTGKKIVDQVANELLINQSLFQQLDASLDNPAINKLIKDDLVNNILTTLRDALPLQPGVGCNVEQFIKSEFHPGWKWEKTQDVDWAKLPSVAPGSNRWFTDIDGDGLTDLLTSTGQPLLDFEQAQVDFTQRYVKGYLSESSDPAQIPFVFDGNQPPHSLAPSVEGAKRGTKYYYVDMNGDGLVDLVTHNSADSSGVPRVRPGNGHGEFACVDSQQPWPCQELSSEVSRIYEIEVPGAYKPWPFNEDTFFHDVTGDGLADIVKYDMSSGDVRLWVNQDGHTFACVTGSAAKPCWVGIVLDERTGTFNIGDHRTTFADMNADGTDDIVILANRGAYVGTFMNTIFSKIPGFSAVVDKAGAHKPGLLIRIDNGFGATTSIQYQTIQQLDLLVKDTPTAWQYHSPVVESVVTKVITQDSDHANSYSNLIAPYQFNPHFSQKE